jgi:hypothetical protein
MAFKLPVDFTDLMQMFGREEMTSVLLRTVAEGRCLEAYVSRKPIGI